MQQHPPPLGEREREREKEREKERERVRPQDSETFSKKNLDLAKFFFFCQPTCQSFAWNIWHFI